MAASEGFGAIVVTHPLDAGDASIVGRIRTATPPQKGLPWRIETRKQYDALMEGMSPLSDISPPRWAPERLCRTIASRPTLVSVGSQIPMFF
jgi:hypothetical protein